MSDATAKIKDGCVVIQLSLDNLPMVVEGAWACYALTPRMKVTDAAQFAKELVAALNREEEDGTTLVHKMFDKGIIDAIEQGAEGIEEHEDQQA